MMAELLKCITAHILHNHDDSYSANAIHGGYCYEYICNGLHLSSKAYVPATFVCGALTIQEDMPLQQNKLEMTWSDPNYPITKQLCIKHV